MGVPLLIGYVLDKTNPEVAIAKANGTEIPVYDYTYPMLIFTLFGLLAIIVAYLLKHEDKKKGYGLELPNIKQ